ncbi:DNA-binding domain-containing protein [Sphingomonas sp.]|uniref:DNA-binding domain-containing protein n=1 Tax=Sphingomonas sp. TaxID=28214 RepID=UPI002B8227EB|nr:DNA-binding domain-containing protein [Sphingomonas sp.]HTG39138.1 DNA-binding domain-containing protein [Sphingomonas sp.]
MSLLALQRDMRAWLVHEDAAAAGRIGAMAKPGLDVYQNNYRSQLVACLEGSFARTQAWIGDEAFLHAAVLHIDRIPPSSWTLDAYSRDFPMTLATLHPDDPEISEIARIELAIEEVFVAPDCRVIAVDQLQDVSWDRAILGIAPTIDLVDLDTNAFAIWSALVAETPPPPADRLDTPGAAIVWRQDYRARIRPIDALERQALMQVRAGRSFGVLCDATADAFGQEQGTALAGGWLGRWIADGLITSIANGSQETAA